ncbi:MULTISPECIES: hypothetical protein [unclassified Carboxylicivirga]|uniref:hypothetical protein n=1 Tax=Carboxylicivirga TaxID=1628153 RepID=UPI003D34549F
MIIKHTKYSKGLYSLALMLVMQFAIQIASYALFYHTHSFEGKVYSHAHPGSDGHSHTTADYAFYQQLQNLTSEEIPGLIPDVPLNYLKKVALEAPVNTVSRHIENKAGRAPPVA